MLLQSVEVPLFLPSLSLSFFFTLKLERDRGSSLGEIGLWSIVNPHSEAILSSEKYNEL